MTSRLTSVDSLTDTDIDRIIGRSEELAGGAPARSSQHRPALVFLDTSLRTRIGFIAAAHRLSWPTPAEVFERRSSETSMPESLEDTLSVVAAYFDTIITRVDRPIDTVAKWTPTGVRLVNAGDRGPQAEHPTQALIDTFAMARLVGDVADLHVALCGDLRMRAARSLLKMLARRPPAALTLVTDAALTDDLVVPQTLPYQVVNRFDEVADPIDALHSMGIPHGAAAEDVRTRLRVDTRSLASLSSRGRVFSPMPVIDEVAESVRQDRRVAYIPQSALGFHVRTAVLESLAW